MTGGASGIGKIMARRLLAAGARVVLWDVNAAGLRAVLTEFSRKGDIRGWEVDVAQPEAIAKAARETLQEVGHVDLVVNNAGIVVGKYFHEHSTADILRTNDINATAPQLIARAFLPSMIERGRGHYCNVASSAGLVANPKMTVYAGSKWSLVGFSESLRVEMEQLGLPIKVTTVLPYYINTGMFDGVKSRIPILDPEKAAASILEAVARDETLLTLPRYIYRLTRLSQGVLSTRGLDWFAGRVFGVYRTMEGWTGRGA